MGASVTNTELAVLGLISEGPKYGYQIEQDVQQRGMREWTEIGFSSIYYVLTKLEAAGWLSSERHGAGRRPARTVYQLTVAGLQAHHDAVLDRLATPRPRSGDFELALANLDVLSHAECVTALTSRHDQLKEHLKLVRARLEQDASKGSLTSAQVLYDHSAAMLRAEIAWIEALLTRLGRARPGSRVTYATTG